MSNFGVFKKLDFNVSIVKILMKSILLKVVKVNIRGKFKVEEEKK